MVGHSGSAAQTHGIVAELVLTRFGLTFVPVIVAFGASKAHPHAICTGERNFYLHEVGVHGAEWVPSIDTSPDVQWR